MTIPPSILAEFASGAMSEADLITALGVSDAAQAADLLAQKDNAATLTNLVALRRFARQFTLDQCAASAAATLAAIGCNPQSVGDTSTAHGLKLLDLQRKACNDSIRHASLGAARILAPPPRTREPKDESSPSKSSSSSKRVKKEETLFFDDGYPTCGFPPEVFTPRFHDDSFLEEAGLSAAENSGNDSGGGPLRISSRFKLAPDGSGRLHITKKDLMTAFIMGEIYIPPKDFSAALEEGGGSTPQENEALRRRFREQEEQQQRQQQAQNSRAHPGEAPRNGTPGNNHDPDDDDNDPDNNKPDPDDPDEPDNRGKPDDDEPCDNDHGPVDRPGSNIDLAPRDATGAAVASGRDGDRRDRNRGSPHAAILPGVPRTSRHPPTAQRETVMRPSLIEF